jgi:hypothetical protein
MIDKLLFCCLLVIFFITGCSDKDAWVVLYKEEVAEGNSIVYFANPNDKTGYWAEEHCLELAKLYEEEDETTDYICSKVVDEKYVPKVN